MQSKLNKITACLALGCFAIGVANAQTGNPAYDAWAKASGPKPGLFEYKMTTEMSGMPGMGTMKMPTKTMRHCVTQKDIDEGRQFMTGQKDTGFKCTITDFSKQGNIVNYTQSCSGQGMKMNSIATLEQKGDIQIHTSKTTMQSPEFNTKSNNVMEIRRIGDCK